MKSFNRAFSPIDEQVFHRLISHSAPHELNKIRRIFLHPTYDAFYSIEIQHLLWNYKEDLPIEYKEGISKFIADFFRIENQEETSFTGESSVLAPRCESNNFNCSVPIYSCHGFDGRRDIEGYAIALEYLDKSGCKVNVENSNDERSGVPTVHIDFFDEECVHDYLSTRCVRCGGVCDEHVHWPCTQKELDNSLCPLCSSRHMEEEMVNVIRYVRECLEGKHGPFIPIIAYTKVRLIDHNENVSFHYLIDCCKFDIVYHTKPDNGQYCFAGRLSPFINASDGSEVYEFDIIESTNGISRILGLCRYNPVCWGYIGHYNDFDWPIDEGTNEITGLRKCTLDNLL